MFRYVTHTILPTKKTHLNMSLRRIMFTENQIKLLRTKYLFGFKISVVKICIRQHLKDKGTKVNIVELIFLLSII